MQLDSSPRSQNSLCLDGSMRSCDVSDCSTQPESHVTEVPSGHSSSDLSDFCLQLDSVQQSQRTLGVDGSMRNCDVSDCSTQIEGIVSGVPGGFLSSNEKCKSNIRGVSRKVLDNVSLKKFGICFYNIHGLSIEKLSDNMLGSFFKTFSLILICETWLAKSQTDEFNILDGYSFYNLHRSYRHPNAIRESGGLGIYVRRSFEHGIDLFNKLDDVICTLRLKKEVFGLPFDLYVSNCYIVPANSTHLVDDPFSLVQRELAKVPYDAGSLSFLDSNAHTNITCDFSLDIDGSSGFLDALLPSDDSADNALILDLYNQGFLNRVSSDNRPLNSHGRDFIDMCKSSRKLILNSRLPGNDFKIGKSTHYNPDGSSGVLDYAISSPNLFNFITHFEVHDKFPESDHCPISVEFPIDINQPPPVKSSKSNSNVTWVRGDSFVWTKNDLPKLAQVFDCKGSSSDYLSFVDSITCNENSDQVASLFNSFVIKSCKRALKSKRSRKLRKRKFRRIDFFDKECRQRRIEAIKAGSRVITNADRNNLINKTKLYKSCIQRKRRQKKAERKHKLLQIFEKNAASVWAELNKSDMKIIDSDQRESF